jgi:glyoxylase-like metal-dependent hydrolase (beta-lactamase superfamily II)
MTVSAIAHRSPRPAIAFDPVLPYGKVETVLPDVRRVIANNPGPLTERGTNTWIVGHDELVVIDPGPDDPAHLTALLQATARARIAAVLITHTHADHYGNASAFAQATGAQTFGFGPHPTNAAQGDGRSAPGFCPDHLLPDGARLDCGGMQLLALHTPGHCSTHLCFAREQDGLLFTGDHVLAWSTTVVAPPDGDIGAYFGSLDRLTRRQDRVYLTGHGPPSTEPQQLLTGLIGFARSREARALATLRRLGSTTPAAISIELYGDRLDPKLADTTRDLMHAHLLQFARQGLAAQDGDTWRAL